MFVIFPNLFEPADFLKIPRTMLSLQLATILLALLFDVVLAGTSVSKDLVGCDTSGVADSSFRSGFDITFYNYPFRNYDTAKGTGSPNRITYTSAAYLAGGYVDKGTFGSTTGVKNLTFGYALPASKTVYYGTLPDNYKFDTKFTLSNFSMLATGYFYAPTTGDYTFFLEYIDDYAVVTFGGEDAFTCCKGSTSVDKTTTFDLSAMWTSGNKVGGSSSLTSHLYAGVFYPIRLFFSQTNNAGGLKFYYTDPEGVTHKEFEDVIYSIDDQPESCPEIIVTTTLPWTGSYTTTAYTVDSTYTNSEGTLTTGRVVVVETPLPVTTTTKTFG